jgi:hypothetical protein
MTDELLDALAEAERASALFTSGGSCQACDAIQAATSPERKEALTRALAGTIGRDKLVPILQAQGINVGKRHLVRHRQEKHGV